MEETGDLIETTKQTTIKMKVENNKVVAVSYKLEVEGKIADQSAPGSPLEYIHGTGMLLPKFEAALAGKEPGDGFDFVLSPDDGYGRYDPSYKIDLPKTAFAVNGQIREVWFDGQRRQHHHAPDLL